MEYSENLYLWVNVPAPEEFGRKLFAQEEWSLKICRAMRLPDGSYELLADSLVKLNGRDASFCSLSIDDKLQSEVSFIMSGSEVKEFDGVVLGDNSNLHISFATDGTVGVISSTGCYAISAKEMVDARSYRWFYDDDAVDEDEAIERANFLDLLERAKKLG